jgi:hypothetical protein
MMRIKAILKTYSNAKPSKLVNIKTEYLGIVTPFSFPA